VEGPALRYLGNRGINRWCQLRQKPLGGNLEDEESFLSKYTSLVQRGIFYHFAAKRNETGEKP
jgi:hypothetical protein